jgi:hypothetical protein
MDEKQAEPRAELESPAPVESIQHKEDAVDVFVERPDHDIHYKTLRWEVCDRVFYILYY